MLENVMKLLLDSDCFHDSMYKLSNYPIHRINGNTQKIHFSKLREIGKKIRQRVSESFKISGLRTTDYFSILIRSRREMATWRYR